MNKPLNRDQVIASMCDLFGYSLDDFEHDTTVEIIEDMTEDQLKQFKAYNA